MGLLPSPARLIPRDARVAEVIGPSTFFPKGRDRQASDQKLAGHKRLASNEMVLVIEAVDSEIKSSLITLAIPSKPVKIAPVFR
jgi:hypothetical protein